MIERRTYASEVERRTAGENRSIIEGYAYKFNTLSQVLGQFREQIADGAGKASIETDDIRALMNHDANLILGRNTSGTLRAVEDSTGLHYEIEADERQSYVKDLLISLERGDVSQSSFGFRAVHDDWEMRDGEAIRTVTDMKLFDVSPVTYPAYLDATSGVSQRSLDKAAELMTGIEAVKFTIDVRKYDGTDVPLRGRLTRL